MKCTRLCFVVISTSCSGFDIKSVVWSDWGLCSILILNPWAILSKYFAKSINKIIVHYGKFTEVFLIFLIKFSFSQIYRTKFLRIVYVVTRGITVELYFVTACNC